MYDHTGLLAFVGDLAVVEISSGCGCILLECALVEGVREGSSG